MKDIIQLKLGGNVFTFQTLPNAEEFLQSPETLYNVNIKFTFSDENANTYFEVCEF